MKLFSELSGNTVSINEKHFEEFKSVISNSRYFDEDKINNLVYYIYDVYEEIEFDITKKRLLLRVAELADTISIDNIMELKHFELTRLLKVNNSNVPLAYENIISGISEKSDNYNTQIQ